MSDGHGSGTPRSGGIADPRGVVEAVAFWIAALLPLAYLPLVLAIEYGPAPLRALFALVAINAVALLVGHRHEPSLL